MIFRFKYVYFNNRGPTTPKFEEIEKAIIFISLF